MNPIIYRQGVCDPHVHIYEGKAYMYATKDNPGQVTGFQMTEWQIWSSENLVDWKLERRIFPKDLYCGPIDQCWAVDAGFKNGRYYWYYSVGAIETGVAVSDSPAGPFRDALGKPLVGEDSFPPKVKKWDPCCFIDDDGQAYLIVGHANEPKPYDAYLIAKLEEDMISLTEPLRLISYSGNPYPEDKPTIHKHNGTYYLSHASYYATADNVYGPYRYRGNYAANVDHNSFFSWHGQDYNASGGLDSPAMFYRASYLCYVHYRKNGEMAVDQQVIQYGVGRYDSCWDRIEAEWFFETSGTQKEELPDGGFAVTDIRRKSFLCYPNISHMLSHSTITFRCACAHPDGCTIAVRDTDPEGALLGSVHVPCTGSRDSYRDFSVRLANPAGTNSLCLVFDGGEGELLCLDSFTFCDGLHRRTSAEAHLGRFTGSVRRRSDPTSAAHWTASIQNVGDSVTLSMDGGEGGAFDLAVSYAVGLAEEAELSLEINGRPAGTLRCPPTGSEQIGAHPALLHMPVELKPGLNQICLARTPGSRELEVLIDCLVLTGSKNNWYSRSAADMDIQPLGNGPWGETPLRENDERAFTGRIVTNLLRPDSSLTLRNLDGESGGNRYLLIHYATPEDAEFTLLINGQDTSSVHFPATGSRYMDHSGCITVPVCLSPGKNTLELRKNGNAGNLTVDAITLLPEI